MKTAARQAKAKPGAARRRSAGRPVVDDPMVSFTLRIDPIAIEKLDAWAKDNGNMNRSTAIRMAVSEFLKRRAVEKSV